jgi:hypothetical protein
MVGDKVRKYQSPKDSVFIQDRYRRAMCIDAWKESAWALFARTTLAAVKFVADGKWENNY